MASWERAAQLVDRALELKPDDPMALAMRSEARAMLAAARFEALDEATLDELERGLATAVEGLPRSDYVFFARGLFYIYARADPGLAHRAADRVLELNPTYVPGLELEGLVHLAAGAFEAAAERFERAVALGETDPLVPYRLYLQALAQLWLGVPEEALETIARARHLRPRAWGFARIELVARERLPAMPSPAAAASTEPPRAPSILAPRPRLPAAYAGLIERLRP